MREIVRNSTHTDSCQSFTGMHTPKVNPFLTSKKSLDECRGKLDTWEHELKNSQRNRTMEPETKDAQRNRQLREKRIPGMSAHQNPEQKADDITKTVKRRMVRTVKVLTTCTSFADQKAVKGCPRGEVLHGTYIKDQLTKHMCALSKYSDACFLVKYLQEYLAGLGQVKGSASRHIH